MKGKLERPEPKAATGPGQGEAVPGGQGGRRGERMFRNKSRTGYNYLVSWRASLSFNTMDKQAILGNVMFL